MFRGPFTHPFHLTKAHQNLTKNSVHKDTANPIHMEFTQAQTDAHNALTKEGWDIIRGQLILDDATLRRPPGFFARRKLKRAIKLFEQALTINPAGWSSMWALGKIWQRMQDQDLAFAWFLKAHRIKPDQPDVAREAGLSALDSGHFDQAVELCQKAVQLKPDDFGLLSNLALAYLMQGNDEQAKACAAAAVKGDPVDSISQTVLRFVLEVKTGQTKRPAKLSDVFPIH